MLQLAICDDNPLHLNNAAATAGTILPPAEAEISTFLRPSLLLERVRSDAYSPNIAILDIEMEDMDGITLAGILNQLVPECRIIFLTSHLDYASDVYTTRHSWFVVQDRATGYLEMAIHKAVSELSPAAAPQRILLNFKGKTLVVPLSEINYLVREGRKTRVVCERVSHLVTQSPIELIPAAFSDQLIRCHQGYWVNLAKVQALEKNEFVLADGTRIPISRTQRDQARRRFFGFHSTY